MPAAPTLIYLPYVDEQGAGMQRFGQEMIGALARAGLRFELLIGEKHGRADWLETREHRVLVPPAVARALPRGAAALVRLGRVQQALGAPGRTVLALAHELATWPRGRQIAVVHDFTWFKPFAPPRTGPERARDAAYRAGLRRSEVIAISEATRRDAVAWAGLDPARIPVVYEGYDPEIFRPGEPAAPERPLLLHAGTLAVNKNIPFLLRVFARVRDKGLDARLRLVGRYPDEEARALHATVPERWRADVDFAGFVTNVQLGEEMRACTAFVFPSRNEGFGLAAVEAMACGAPILSSPGGSLAEVVADGGWLLGMDDEDAWVEALGRVLSDAQTRAALREQALARARVFSWDRAAEEYREIIERRDDARR